MKIQGVMLLLLTFGLMLDFIVVIIGSAQLHIASGSFFGFTGPSITLTAPIPYWSTWIAISSHYAYFVALYIPLILMYARPSVKLFFGSLIVVEIATYLAILTGVI